MATTPRKPTGSGTKAAGTTRRRTPAKPAAAKSPTTKTTAGKGRKAPQSANSIGMLGIGAAIAAAGAAALGIYRLLTRPQRDGTVPTDLMGDTHPDGSERAIERFRPDPTAPIPDSERDQFRPALAGASAPTLVRGGPPELDRLDATPS